MVARADQSTTIPRDHHGRHHGHSIPLPGVNLLASDAPANSAGSFLPAPSKQASPGTASAAAPFFSETTFVGQHRRPQGQPPATGLIDLQENLPRGPAGLQRSVGLDGGLVGCS